MQAIIQNFLKRTEARLTPLRYFPCILPCYLIDIRLLTCRYLVYSFLNEGKELLLGMNTKLLVDIFPMSVHGIARDEQLFLNP